MKDRYANHFRLDQLIGDSPAMDLVRGAIESAAAIRTPLLIQGECGTGKELVARAIHASSERSAEKFIQVNFAALSPRIHASELFGPEKGSVPGSAERQSGRIEKARGGTIFLDGIDALALPAQAGLLPLLVEDPVAGGARLIAATNQDLAGMVEAGTFRGDLFSLLHARLIELPPLRARAGDIPLLAAAFGERFTEAHGRPARVMADDAMHAMLRYEWPANVRELEVVVEYGVVLATGPKITLMDLPAPIRDRR